MLVTRIFLTSAKVFAVSSLLLAPCHMAFPQEQQEQAQIVGEVVVQVPENAPFPDIAGKTLPRKNFPVYIFSWKESPAIRDWLQKLENDMKALNEDPDDLEKLWIAQKRTEDVYRMVTPAPPGHSTKTDRNGRFVFKNLKVGEKYLVIGAALEQNGIHLVPQTVGPLSPGENKVILVDKW